MKKTVVILICLSIVYSCNKTANDSISKAVPSLPVIEVQKGKSYISNEYPSVIQGETDVEIRPQINGLLQKIMVDEGTYVQKGQPLFKIEEQSYRQSLKSAKANALEAKAMLFQKELEIKKLKPLIENKVVSNYQMETANAEKLVAESRLKQAKSRVETAMVTLDYTIVRAPINGYIGLLPKKVGALVSPSDTEPLTILSDTRKVHTYFTLSETDYMNFKRVSQNKKSDEVFNVSLILGNQMSYDQPGKIDMISNQFDKRTGGIVFRASFPNPEGILKSGNTGKIVMKIPYENTIAIPQESTIEIQDKIFVYLVDHENKVKKQPIQIRGASGTNYLVHKGLSEGQRMVYKGFENLQDGDEIQPKSDR